MFKIIFESYKITNKALILAAPLVLFCTLFALYYSYLISETDSVPKHIFSIVTIFIVVSGLLGSWLYSIKKGLALVKQVYIFDSDRNKALLSIFPYLLKGFGRLFLPCSGFIALNIILYITIFSGIAYLTVCFPNLRDNVATLWLLVFYIYTFLTILWIPEIVYNERNALYALVNSVIKVFTQFKDTMSLYLFIFSLFTIILALLFQFIYVHPILSFLLIMVFYYIILYIIVLLFTYYEQKFLNPEK